MVKLYFLFTKKALDLVVPRKRRDFAQIPKFPSSLCDLVSWTHFGLIFSFVYTVFALCTFHVLVAYGGSRGSI